MAPKTFVHSSLLIGAALMLGACAPVGEPASARVDCGAPGPNGVDCTIKRTAGEGGFEACWNLVITCSNGGRMTGSACQQVAAEEAEVVSTMPVESFSNQQSCDVPASGKVEALELTAR